MIDLIQERWDVKLANWALWVLGGGGSRSGGGLSREWWNCPPRPPQPLVGEALDTDELVGQLSDDHAAALRAWYLWTTSVDESARELRIHPNTLRVRVIGARYRLDDLDSDRRRACARVVAAPHASPSSDPGAEISTRMVV